MASRRRSGNVALAVATAWLPAPMRAAISIGASRAGQAMIRAASILTWPRGRRRGGKVHPVPPPHSRRKRAGARRRRTADRRSLAPAARLCPVLSDPGHHLRRSCRSHIRGRAPGGEPARHATSSRGRHAAQGHLPAGGQVKRAAIVVFTGAGHHRRLRLGSAVRPRRRCH